MATPACNRYLPFVRTAGGNTLADPWGWVATMWDYSEWKDAAARWVGLVESNFDKYQAQFGATESDFGVMDFKARLDDLPWAGSPFLDDADGQRAVNLARDAACRLGELEDAMAEAGVQADIPYDPESRPDATDDTWLDEPAVVATGFGAGLGLVLVLYLVFRER